MKKHLWTGMALILSLGACQRTSTEMWEDTKTASRYMGKGMRSLFGKHSDPRDYAAWNQWESEGDYVPLEGSERYAASPDIRNYPPSKESPGDPGSLIPGIERFIVPTGALAAIFHNVQFELDNYSVKGEENLRALHAIADYLLKHPHTYVFIEGHADERGTAAYNLALGSKRANAIRSFLVQNGVKSDQLFTISFGKERPLSLGHSEGSWKLNRRGQFRLYAR